jgi:hypothetical protein
MPDVQASCAWLVSLVPQAPPPPTFAVQTPPKQ